MSQTFRCLLMGIAVAGLWGCTTDPQAIVLSPLDANTVSPHGNVRPLTALVGNDDPITVVLIHGMGDHCPGFAVGSRDGTDTQANAWLNDKTLGQIGMTLVPGPETQSIITAAELHLGNPEGGPSDSDYPAVVLRERDYLLRLSGTHKVHAVEITWSPLTIWAKDSQLSYDASRVKDSDSNQGRNVTQCAALGHDDVQVQVSNMKFMPLPREKFNSGLKWTLLDRSVADALMYAGSYGEAMQTGLAAALCRVVQPGKFRGVGEVCQWPTQDALPPNERVVFITHSLGSRMLYDTLTNLYSLGQNQTGAPPVTNGNLLRYPGLFGNGYARQAAPAIEPLVSKHLAGLYMMANQVSLLGLSNLQLNSRLTGYVPLPELSNLVPNAGGSSTGTTPPLAGPHTAEMAALHLQQEWKVTPELTAKVDPKSKAAIQPEGLLGLISIRNQANARSGQPNWLSIVSFNDTNDILSWHLPYWYAGINSEYQLTFSIADVFVDNSEMLLNLAENPYSAHLDYLKNRAVWRVIVCGAADGIVKDCLSKSSTRLSAQ